MKKLLLLFCLACIFPALAFSQQEIKLHSHNDYLRQAPFWEAFEAGCASIEVDVILQDGELMAAHEKASIDPNRTLKSLYLEPIRSAKEEGKIHSFEFHLLIDCKTEAYSTLDQIIKDASEFEDLLFSPQNPKGLKLIISGNRPKPEEYGNYPEWVLFDYQSKILTADLPWKKIGMVSLNFNQFSVWNGKGEISGDDKSKLKEFIALVHSFGKPVRFWATPDTQPAWKALYEIGVDYINTDHPRDAKHFLNELK